MFVEHFSLHPVTSTQEFRSGFGACRTPKMHIVNGKSTKKIWERLGHGAPVVQSTSRASVLRGNPDSAVGSKLHGHVSLKLAGCSVASFTSSSWEHFVQFHDTRSGFSLLVFHFGHEMMNRPRTSK